MLVKVFLIIFLLIILPLILGSRLTKSKKIGFSKLCMFYISGWIRMLAIFQIIAVPAIFLRFRLSLVVAMWLGVCVGVSIINICVYRKMYALFLENIKRNRVYLSEILVIVLIVIQIIGITIFSSSDADDALYVGAAVTSEYTDTMYLYEGDSGRIYKDFPTRYVMSPFPIFIALISRIVFIHPMIVAHTILPPILILLSYISFYLLIRMILKGDRRKIAYAMCMLSVLNIWGNISAYTAATFLLKRIWQGKAVLANVIIPYILYLLIKIYSRYEKKNKIVLKELFLTTTSGCLISSMGIFLLPMMIGVHACIYARQKKSGVLFKKLLICCLPCVLYGIMYLIMLKEIFGVIPQFT